MLPIDSFEDFRQQLQNALLHLHDPDYVVPEDLRRPLALEPQANLPAFQSAMMQAIESLRPGPQMPPASRAEYLYEVLRQRFVLGLTQEKAAERLDLSVRSLQRIQREATHVLARSLWDRRPPAPSADRAAAAPPAEVPAGDASSHAGWSSQLRQELLLLQAQSPEAECQLAEALAGAARIFQAKSGKRIPIDFPQVDEPAQVRFHPTVLRQIIVNLLDTVGRSMPGGQIRLWTEAGRAEIVLHIQAQPAPAQLPDLALARELLAVQQGAIHSGPLDGALDIAVRLPLRQPHPAETTVLVVDDNRDLVDLYQSYCVGTNYKIEAIGEGKQIFAAVERTRPEIILLDILLPDVDGWDLLLELHVNPLTKDIPIIVCSVVTDEQLVLDLGAVLYLRKPVWRDPLLAAFEGAKKNG